VSERNVAEDDVGRLLSALGVRLELEALPELAPLRTEQKLDQPLVERRLKTMF
jgi:hypothetical protein